MGNVAFRITPRGPGASSGGDPVTWFERDLATPKNLVHAVVLLLLDERPGHGYELIRRSEPLGFDPSNPGRIYRALQRLEREHLVKPEWLAHGSGPARRVYTVSPDGRRALESASRSMRRHAKTLDGPVGDFMLRRLRLLERGKQSFPFRVETLLTVHASSEAAARGKLERAFAQRHVTDPDIRTTSEVSIRPVRTPEDAGQGEHPDAVPGAGA